MKVIITEVAYWEDDEFIGILGVLKSVETDYEYATVLIQHSGRQFLVPVVNYIYPSKLILELF